MKWLRLECSGSQNMLVEREKREKQEIICSSNYFKRTPGSDHDPDYGLLFRDNYHGYNSAEDDYDGNYYLTANLISRSSQTIENRSPGRPFRFFIGVLY